MCIVASCIVFRVIPLTQNPYRRIRENLLSYFCTGSKLTKPPTSSHRRSCLQSFFCSRWPRRFAIAALLALVTIGAFLWDSGPHGSHIPFANVVNKIRQTHTMVGTFAYPEGPIVSSIYTGPPPLRLMLKGACTRVESDGEYVVSNRDSGHMVTFYSGSSLQRGFGRARPKKDAWPGEIRGPDPFDVYGWLGQYRPGQERFIGKKWMNGRRAQGFQVSLSNGLATVFWIDPNTQLPIRLELRCQGVTSTTLTDLDFDTPLDDNLFDLSVPDGCGLQGFFAERLAPPPTSREMADLILKPGVGIGPLQFGASREQVIAVFGQPYEILANGHFLYPSRGLDLTIAPEQGLATIAVYSNFGFGRFASLDFNGTIQNGIIMGATRKQIEAAFGPPTDVSDNKNLKLITLHYAESNTLFHLAGDRLGHVILMRPVSK